ncbi:MAG: hypothetical protein HQL16_04915 [Candidatus Omnitrophica bacterium]|nr:hypothetical protein [Candidatus Omnitrophota bacterium]
MRRVIFIIVVFLTIFFAALVAALNSPWLSVKLARRILRSALKEVKLTEVVVTRQHFTMPGEVEFTGVRLLLMIKGKPLTINVPHCHVTGLQTFFSNEPRVFITVKDAAAQFPPGEARNVGAELSFSMTADKKFVLSGPVSAQEASWDRFKAAQVSFFLAGAPERWEFRAIKASAYGGGLAGKAQVVFSQVPAYDVELFLSDMLTTELSKINLQISEQLGGKIGGAVHVTGNGEKMSSLATDLSMPGGGKMSASLLGVLTQYIPQSREKKMLDDLIKVGGLLDVEVLSFSMKSDSPRHLSGEVHILSKAINVELNITNDINTDGTLESLLSYWQAYLK